LFSKICFLSISFRIIRSKKRTCCDKIFKSKLSLIKILKIIEKIYGKEALNGFFVQYIFYEEKEKYLVAIISQDKHIICHCYKINEKLLMDYFHNNKRIEHIENCFLYFN